MDREALIARLREIAGPEVRPFAFDETMWKSVRRDLTQAATALASDAKLLEELKGSMRPRR